MSDCGSDGIKNNCVIGKVEPLISVQQLKDRYLYGKTQHLIDANGNPIPDESLQHYINSAVSMLEHYLDISIAPICTLEKRDYQGNDYWEWGYLQLNNIPVIQVKSMKVVYLTDDQGQPDTILDIPQNWIRVNPDNGLIRLVPNNRFPASLQVDGYGTFFPELFRRNSNVPSLWHIEYTHGFEDGKVPSMVNSAIGMLASLTALVIAGDQIAGAGIAGQSLSIDGLSQSIQTTSSAENSGYSSSILEYRRNLFGTSQNDPFAILRILREYYQGSPLNII